MSDDRPTKPQRKRSSQRLLAMPGTSARVEVAAEVIARTAREELRARIERALADHAESLPVEVLAPIRDLVHEAIALTRTQTARVVRAYAGALRGRYAAALHAARPGAELPDDRPTLGELTAFLAADGVDATPDELRALCVAVGLDVAEDGG